MLEQLEKFGKALSPFHDVIFCSVSTVEKPLAKVNFSYQKSKGNEQKQQTLKCNQSVIATLVAMLRRKGKLGDEIYW